jgi:DNA mismatch endonuclease, patch repair protein
MSRTTPSYKGLSPASTTSARVARASSAKRNTGPELLLRQAMRKHGIPFNSHVASLPGNPDFVVYAARLAVFCDGDFWHGRSLKKRLAALASGHNSLYWVSKISSNVRRDRRVNRRLRDMGWTPVRLWESDIRADPDRAVIKIVRKMRG